MNIRRPLTELAALVVLIELLGGALAAKAAATNVLMSGFSFTPVVVNIKVGDTITWVNQGGSHTASGTGSDPICGNGTIAVSQSVTFNTAGSFPYRCNFHFGFGMTGLVVVATSGVAPTVSITTPTNGARFFSGSSFPVTFAPNDADGTVSKVELFEAGSLVFTLPAPFTTNIQAGGLATHTVVAVATDNGGLMGTSAPVTFQFLSTNVTLVPSSLSTTASFTVSNTAVGHTYLLDALTNFTGTLPANWFPLATNTAPSNNFIFSDSVLTNQLPRLYRVRQSL